MLLGLGALMGALWPAYVASQHALLSMLGGVLARASAEPELEEFGTAAAFAGVAVLSTAAAWAGIVAIGSERIGARAGAIPNFRARVIKRPRIPLQRC